MASKEILGRIQKYVHPFRVTKGKDFRLKDYDPGDTRGLSVRSESCGVRRVGCDSREGGLIWGRPCVRTRTELDISAIICDTRAT